MRRLIAFFLLFLSVGLVAQDIPQFSQHVNLQGLINPAYNGSRESYSALMVTRNQWAGSLITHALNVHAPLPIKGLGAGLVVLQDNAGLYSKLHTKAAISYRLNLSKEIMFSAGLQGGLVREQIETANTVQGSDIALNNFGKTTNRPSAGFGLFLYSKDFFAGLSMPEVLPNGFEMTKKIYNDVPLFIYGGYLLDVHPDVKLKPTAFIQATYSAPFMMELGLHAFYKEYGSFGIATRMYPFSALVFSMEVQAVENLFIGYSYDLNLEAEQGMKNGTHELSLRFDISATRMLTKPVGSMRFY